MYRNTLYLLLSLAMAQSARSQDLIIKQNGDTVLAKVLKISPFEVTYRNYNNTDTQTSIIANSSIALIRYPNGTADTFKTTTQPDDVYSYRGARLTEKAKQDAKMYYKHYREAKQAVTIITVLNPIYGLVPAMACANKQPKSSTLNCPYPRLMYNEEYREAYSRKAWEIKRKEVWRGYGTGAAIYGAVVLAILAAVLISLH